MSPWLKAGLIGAAILIVLNLLGLVQVACVGLVTCILGLLVYAGIGALAAYWMPPVRETGAAAGQGALAAGLAAIIGGIVNMIVVFIQATIVGTTEIVSQLPPETLRQLEDAGMDPAILNKFAGPAGALLGGSLCCVGGLILAAILGAVGGAVFAAIQKD
jgi:hypothetical protein